MSTAEGALGELPPPPIQQEGLTNGSDGDEIITVEESAVGLQALPVTPVGGGGGCGNASAAIDASTTTTASDGTIRTRLGPRQHQQQASPSGGALCCGGGSSADSSSCSPVDRIAVAPTSDS
ncbi:unnamed protein product [Ectocarpus sp. CCAP 1310/34]|nr:unnamed protein product [Ectocarpus sp. CCAP 1310/34]